MNIQYRLNTFLLLVLLGATPSLMAQSVHRQLRKGEELYDKKQYIQAENTYQQAASSPEAVYNAGNSAYQQGKYDAAAELFKKAAAISTGAGARASAYHNLGNTYLRTEKYEAAIAAYESSLRLQPNRPDTKKNLQIAKNKLREQQQPPPPPPPQRPPPPPRPRNNYVDRAQSPQKPEQPGGTMTADAARQLLVDIIEQEEQANARQYRALPPEARPARTKKDW